MRGSSDLRASDEDRERAAQELRQHYSAGRLDTHEFEERLNAAYDAVTIGDLAVLKRDLPPVDVGGGVGGGSAGSGGGKSGKSAAGALGAASGAGTASGLSSGTQAESHALALREARDAIGRRALHNGGRRLVVFGGCSAIWAVSGGGFFWPVFVLIYTLIIAARSYWSLYGPVPDVERIEHELRRRRKRQRREAVERRGREFGEEAMGWWIAQTSARQAAAELRRQERENRK